MCAFTSLFKEKSKFPLKLSSINSEEIISSSLPVNIIFLGGSVTEGYNTMYDCKEPYEKDRCEQCYGKYTEGLYRYFQSILDPSIKVTMILLTSGGWTSEVQGDKIIQNLRKQGLVSISIKYLKFNSINNSAIFSILCRQV